jgi:hypothetical protein
MRYEPVSRNDFRVEWGTLLQPAAAFEHPRDVVNDPDLTLHEKRAILASWASDAQAAVSAPALRQADSRKPVRLDEILVALRSLDEIDLSVREDPRKVWSLRGHPRKRRDPGGWNGAPL